MSMPAAPAVFFQILQDEPRLELQVVIHVRIASVTSGFRCQASLEIRRQLAGEEHPATGFDRRAVRHERLWFVTPDRLAITAWSLPFRQLHHYDYGRLLSTPSISGALRSPR